MVTERVSERADIDTPAPARSGDTLGYARVSTHEQHPEAQNARLISERTRDGIAAARQRGRQPGRPPLDPETVSAAQKLIEAGVSPARAAKQPGIGRATAYRIAAEMREGASAPLM